MRSTALQTKLRSISLGGALAVACLAPPAWASALPKAVEDYRQVFSEDFQRLDLSPDGRGDHTWYNGVWFHNQVPPNSSIDTSRGYLSLHWRRGQGSPETSITTLARDVSHFRAWRYGYFEARMKWKPVRGAWPGFWLIPVQDANRSDVYQGTRKSGEIDIFEGQGDKPQIYYATIHELVSNRDARNNNSHNQFHLPAGTDLSQWHDYGALWTPGKITWYFDGTPIHSETTYEVFDYQDYYLVLTEQAGIHWKAGDGPGVEEEDMTLDVQWVRVWQR
jgi:beta-glucanase (GH16 family)